VRFLFAFAMLAVVGTATSAVAQHVLPNGTPPDAAPAAAPASPPPGEVGKHSPMQPGAPWCSGQNCPPPAPACTGSNCTPNPS
jgi:hypothetical protein